MRKIISCILVLCLLCAASAACAEEKPYLISTGQVNMAYPVSVESYPEIRLTAMGINEAFGTDVPAEGVRFVAFPALDSSPVEFFSRSNARYYYEHMVYEYEVKCTVVPNGLNGASEGNTVLNDPQNGIYAHVSDDTTAYGYYLLQGMGENMALKVIIYPSEEGLPEGTDQRQLMTELITNEMHRLQQTVHYENYPRWWSLNRFAGAKLRYKGSASFLLKIDFPTAEQLGFPQGIDGFAVWGADARCNSLALAFMVSPGVYADMDIFCHAMRLVNPEYDTVHYDYTEVTLDNGSVWMLDTYPKAEEGGEITEVQMSKVIPTPDYDDPAMNKYACYLNIGLRGHGLSWSRPALEMLMKVFDENCKVMTVSEDPEFSGSAAE